MTGEEMENLFTSAPHLCYHRFALLEIKLKNSKERHMKLNRRTVWLSLVLVGTIFLTACPNHESISKINGDPARYRNRDVAIAGTVRDSYGFLDRGAYEIDDGTGTMWVITQRGVPARGSQVGAKGRVRTGFSLGGRSFGTILEESDRRAR
jgi:hypothetical protein